VHAYYTKQLPMVKKGFEVHRMFVYIPSLQYYCLALETVTTETLAKFTKLLVMVHCHCKYYYHSPSVFIQIELHYPFENKHLPLAWFILGFSISEHVNLNIIYTTSIHPYAVSV
jgi:hypothetical protein